MSLIRVVKQEKKRYIRPKRVGHFYRCTCGNHLAGYKKQWQCEDCGAWIDWEDVIKGTDEIEKRRKGSK